MEIIQNIISETLFILLRYMKGAFGTVDKAVCLPSIAGNKPTLSGMQISAIANCVVRVSLFVAVVVLILKAEPAKLGMVLAFLLIMGLFHEAFKD